MSSVLDTGVGAEARRERAVRLLVWSPTSSMLFVLVLALFCGAVGLEHCSAAPAAQSDTPGDGERALNEAEGSNGPPSTSPEALYQRYRSVVERNIFSRFARSPRPEPVPERRREPEPPRPAPAPGSGHVLTGVVAGVGGPVALVEEASTRQTRLYRVGSETPAGRVEAVTAEGVVLQGRGGQVRIAVGYTLAGEKSSKLATTMTTGGGSTAPSPGAASSTSAASTSTAEPAPGSDSRPSREEFVRRMRERRQRELQGAEGR